MRMIGSGMQNEAQKASRSFNDCQGKEHRLRIVTKSRPSTAPPRLRTESDLAALEAKTMSTITQVWRSLMMTVYGNISTASIFGDLKRRNSILNVGF